MYYVIANLVKPLPILVLLLVVGVVLRQRKKTRLRLSLVWLAITGLWCCTSPICAYYAGGTLEWIHPPYEGPLEQVDAIVVLGGGVRAPNEVIRKPTLTEGTLLRCLRAAELARNGAEVPIVLCGGKVHPNRPGPAEAEAMREFLVGIGVSARQLVPETRSRSTYENAREARRVLEGKKKIALVTTARHLFRAVKCFERQGFEVVPIGCQYKATSFRWEFSILLPGFGNGKHIELVHHEWLGVVWYWVKGRI